MVDLDRISVYEKADPLEMIKHIRAFPQLLDTARNQAAKYDFPFNSRGIDKIIMLGMGGSAMGGEIVADLLMSEAKIPVWVHRGYNLPEFADEKSLFVFISYSGNTEETLSGFEKAMELPSKKIVLTSGGKLKELADKSKVFTSIIDYPAAPRAAFPWMFGAMLGMFYKLGLLSRKTSDTKPVVPILDNMVAGLDIGVPTHSNRAKQMAQQLFGKIAVIYGAEFLGGVSRRWKTQVNENGKGWAFFEVLPELLHNSVVGYPCPPALQKNIEVLILRSQSLNPRVLVQIDAVKRVLEGTAIPHQVVDAEGDSLLTQVLTLILLGDFASYYLAILNGVDPTPVAIIDTIKKYQREH